MLDDAARPHGHHSLQQAVGDGAALFQQMRLLQGREGRECQKNTSGGAGVAALGKAGGLDGPSALLSCEDLKSQAAKRELPRQRICGVTRVFNLITNWLWAPTKRLLLLSQEPPLRKGLASTYSHVGMGHLAETTAVGITHMRGKSVDVVACRCGQVVTGTIREVRWEDRGLP